MFLSSLEGQINLNIVLLLKVVTRNEIFKVPESDKWSSIDLTDKEIFASIFIKITLILVQNYYSRSYQTVNLSVKTDRDQW